MKMTKSESGRLRSIQLKVNNELRTAEKMKEYDLYPNTCGNGTCKNPILPYNKRKNKFCSTSCAAIVNNPKKPKRSNLGYFNCLYCGETKRQTHSSRNKFCNNKCEAAFKLKEADLRVEAGTASSAQAKRYLIQKHGQVCLDPICAWDFTKRPIKVELEHIDGNSTNNNLNNLTLLCPNCHSTTATYKSRNKGNGRYERRKRYQEGKSF